MSREDILSRQHVSRLIRAGLRATSASNIAAAKVFGAIKRPLDASFNGDPRVQALQEYLAPSVYDISQLFGIIQVSPFIVANDRYANTCGEISFGYLTDEDIVNACAGTDDDGNPVIILLGGAVRFSRLVSVMAAQDLIKQKKQTAKFLKTVTSEFRGQMPLLQAMRLGMDSDLHRILADEAVRMKADAIAAGVVLSILAHEVGHLVLGHVSRSQTVSDEISRNQEREADSFASSVISASPFGEYMFVGMLFWHYALMRIEEELGYADCSTDHPGSRERYENLIRANQSKARVFGLTV